MRSTTCSGIWTETWHSLRAIGGLQCVPIPPKDPDPVDFSTGSVGLGATAPLWAALAHRYVRSHFADAPPSGRFVSLLGDAELDEGAIWEAIADPAVAKLGELLWVVDLNRQSLDRVVPDIQIQRLQGMFAAAGWQVVTVKWGRQVSELFDRPGGRQLRERLETMPNEEYQRVLRSAPSQVVSRLLVGEDAGSELATLLGSLTTDDLASAVRDLGGHDIGLLLETFRAVEPDRPTVVFAYTIKGRGLPTEGHPNNHSALLTASQMTELAAACGTDVDNPWRTFEPGTAAHQLCDTRAAPCAEQTLRRSPPIEVPVSLSRHYRRAVSTQAALGRVLADLTIDAPDLAARVVTCSPDVASSTNLGGWINKTGVWAMKDRRDWFADDSDRVLRWAEASSGQHIELGIAEVNLVSLLGELGATWSRWGQRLVPVGTIYDPFVSRALEPWSYGIYAGGQSILVGTPSGVTLAPEGGAHQSITTPSIGLEQPGCVAWEPAFAQDLEWCFLDAVRTVGVPNGTSAYFRLSTRPLDQEPRPGPGGSGRAGAAPAAGSRRRLSAPGGVPLGRRGPHPGRDRRDHARGGSRSGLSGSRRGQCRRGLCDQCRPAVPSL